MTPVLVALVALARGDDPPAIDPAWVAPGPKEVEVVFDEVARRLAAAEAAAGPVRTAENELAERLVAGGPVACDDPVFSRHAPSLASQGQLWRDAVQAARAEHRRAVALAAAPTAVGLTDLMWAGRQRDLRRRVVAAEREVLEAMAWYDDHVAPWRKRCPSTGS